MQRMIKQCGVLAFICVFVLSLAPSTRAETVGDDFVILEDPGNGTFVHGVNDVGQRIVSVPTITKKFFETHGDSYDFLAIFTDFPFANPASYLVKSAVKGIGLETNYRTDQYDVSTQYGSRGQLQTVSALAFDFSGNDNIPMELKKDGDAGGLFHEVVHRWGIFASSTLAITNPNVVGHYNPSGHMAFSANAPFPDLVDTGGDILGGEDLLPKNWRSLLEGPIARAAITVVISNLKDTTDDLAKIVRVQPVPFPNETLEHYATRVVFSKGGDLIFGSLLDTTEGEIVSLYLNAWAAALVLRQIQAIKSLPIGSYRLVGPQMWEADIGGWWLKLLSDLEQAEAKITATFTDPIILIWMQEEVAKRKADDLLQAVLKAGVAELPSVFR